MRGDIDVMGEDLTLIDYIMIISQTESIVIIITVIVIDPTLGTQLWLL